MADVKIYPNPAGNTLSVSALNINQQEVQLLDLTGRQLGIRPEQSSVSELTFDVSGLAAGIYLVRLSTNDRTHLTKFVKL